MIYTNNFLKFILTTSQTNYIIESQRTNQFARTAAGRRSGAAPKCRDPQRTAAPANRRGSAPALIQTAGSVSNVRHKCHARFHIGIERTFAQFASGVSMARFVSWLFKTTSNVLYSQSMRAASG